MVAGAEYTKKITELQSIKGEFMLSELYLKKKNQRP